MLFIILAIIAIVIIISCIKVVPEANLFVIEFFGKYKRTMSAGINFKIPIVERVSKKVSLKEQVVDFPPQSVITKDNVTMQIDTVVYYRVNDAKLYAYGVANPIFAIENLTATTLRNIIGEMELDDALTSRDKINSEMRAILDEATDAWGIKIARVELKNIIPPREIQDAMERQMKAERERRETILEAEGHKEAVVKREEGNKEARILEAEGKKVAAIAEAEGKARAIELVYEAQARGLETIKAAVGTEGLMVLKKLETLEKTADGRATKIIVPTELAAVTSDLQFKGEMLGLDKTMDIDESPRDSENILSLDECCEEIIDNKEKELPEISKVPIPTNEERNRMILKLHEETHYPIAACKKACESSQYDYLKAKEALR